VATNAPTASSRTSRPRPARTASTSAWTSPGGPTRWRAHRVLWLAEGTGHQAALKERLLSAYFHEGLDVGDVETLAACAADVGLPADRVAAFLRSDDGVAEVEAGLRAAADAEITAVPTYVIDGRWAVPGAQDTETFVTVLRRVIERRAQDPAG